MIKPTSPLHTSNDLRPHRACNKPSLLQLLIVCIMVFTTINPQGADSDLPAARQLLELMQVRDYLEDSFQNANDSEARINDLFERLANIYADEFSQDELTAITEFYRTPAGIALAEKQTVLSQRTFDAFQEALSVDQTVDQNSQEESQ